MADVAIRAAGLSKQYRIGEKQSAKTLRETITEAVQAPFRRGRRPPRDTIWALKDVSFEIARGEVVGIIGRNGAGKSTLLKILSRITEPTEGHVEIRGRVGSLLEVGTGFHSELTGRENIYLNGAILGMRRAEIMARFDEIVAFAEVEKFLDTPVKHYSSGMYLRLAFAVAAHLEPEILLVDEVLAVGDASFQKKCLGKMGEVAHAGRTVLFVSHNLAAVRRLCSHGLWLEQGRAYRAGDIAPVLDAYLADIDHATTSGSGSVELADRQDRSGNGFVRFRCLRLAAADGALRQTFEFRQPLEIEFEIEASRPVGTFFVGFTVLTSDGIAVFSSHHPDTLEARVLKAGEGATLSCALDPNLLHPGRYLLQMGIADFQTWETYDWFYAATQFTIEPGSGASLDGRPGLLHPVFCWKWKP